MSAAGGLVSTVAAQVGAEVRTRLRSPGTMIAFLALLAGSYLWIPSPEKNAASITWQTPAGALQAPFFSAAYLGVAMALLAGAFQLLFAFYLVAGAVRADRDRKVGAILAATPISKSAYLLGKLAAHVVYLSALTLLVVPVGLYNFARYGVGPLDPVAFLLPTVLVALPGIAFVAAMALLFDVTPGLRSRGGLVIWFFTGMTLLAAAPVGLSGEPGSRGARVPFFDPSGMASLDALVVQSVPEARPKSFSTGLIFHDQPITRVPWPGIALGADFVVARLLGLLWTAVPLLLSIALFDRFDPARGRSRKERPATPRAAEANGVPAAALASGRAELAAPLDLGRLAAVEPHPSAGNAVLAEIALLWQTTPWLRWPLAIASIVAAVLPAPAVPMASLVFLILLAPVLAEVAARESLAGTGPLVFSQPGVPRSAVLWKLAALALFTLAVGLPPLVRFTLLSPAHGFAFLTGLLFTAAFATAAGALSGGGKLFLGLYLWLWYAAASRVPELDFCGVMGGALDLGSRAVYLAVGAAAIGVAWFWERR